MPILCVCVCCEGSFMGRGRSQPRGRVCPPCQQLYGTAESGRVSSFQRQMKRAYDAGVQATLTWKQWWQACEDFEFRCAYCGRRNRAVIEHVTPLNLGGGTCVDNIVPACSWCNWRKGGLPLDQTVFSPETRARIWRYLDCKRQGNPLTCDQIGRKWWLPYGRVVIMPIRTIK
jgi:hypothetical protein